MLADLCLSLALAFTALTKTTMALRLASSVARNGLLYKDSFLLNLCHAFVPVAGKDAS